MPAYTMPGLVSGQNTNDIVQKLVELERRPIRRWETENRYNKAQIEVWTELKSQATNLQNKTRTLSSFSSAFSSKQIKANEDGFVSGDASKTAKSGKKNIEILELASKHQVSGKKIDFGKKLPPGSFTVLSGSEQGEVEFKGGSFMELVSAMKSVQRIATTTLIKVDSDTALLSVTAVKTGERNKLKFLDPSGVLKSAGLVGDPEKEGEISYEAIQLSTDSTEPYQSETFTNNTSDSSLPDIQDKITFKANTGFIFPIQTYKTKENTTLEISLPEGFRTPTAKPTEANEEASTPAPSIAESKLQIGVIYSHDGEEVRRVQTIESKNGIFILSLREIAKEKNISKIIIANPNSSDTLLSKIEWVNPPEVIGALPFETITEAKDAKFKIDGIEITRDRNEAIVDVLEGISLNLLKPTKEPIQMDIVADVKKGLDLVKEFVKAHNELVIFCKEVTAVDKNSKMSDRKAVLDAGENGDISGEFWNQKTRSGLLAGEATIMRLVSGMKTITSANYPSRQEPKFRVLTDIGISTGDVGTSWQKIQEGLLQINEEVLTKALSDHPDSVKELFASDMDEDSKMEEGLGVKLVDHLKPYTQYAGGIVTSKVKLLEDTVADNNKKVKSHEQHLSSYESKLKQRFLYMEQGVGKNKALGNYLKNNMFNNNNNN